MTPTTEAPTRKRRFHLGTSALYFLLPFAVYLVTSIRALNTLVLYAALFLLAAIFSFRFFPRVSRGLRVVVWTLFVLSLVGATSWFLSPLFFALYLMAIGIGFLYSPLASTAFLLSLITIFFLEGSVGLFSLKLDFLHLLSLLAVIPITVALRRNYLVIQQEKKGILILEDERPPSGVTSLDAILQNRVNKIGILLRQPLTYIKQGLALLEGGELTEKESPEVLARMRRGADELFTLVKEFERGTTKHALITRGALRAVRERTTSASLSQGSGELAAARGVRGDGPLGKSPSARRDGA